MKTAEQILEDAADVTAEQGWGQGHAIDPRTGKVCMLGALDVAAGAVIDRVGDSWRMISTTAMHQSEVYEARARLKETVGDRSISWWNDNDCRDQETAILALKHAARGERLPEGLSD